ncbi:zinc finger BED domain-containing protein 5-like [Palaemon carinicauda]|uniref:zinc finger BED domain-containing protein 5-like n=1 Tax=Palaemon carinicauda TaxID=392227 RepID=UPI0035B5C874
MAEDIKTQVVEKVKSSLVFAIQCDESTDVSQCSPLLVYTRFIWKESLEEDMLFCCSLESSTTADDVFKAVSGFFQENDISWEKLIGVCTDGAPAMLGTRSGFVTKVKEKASSVISTHRFIHHRALAAKTLPSKLQKHLNIMIKIVNHIKHSALNTRLFMKLCQDLETDYKTLLFHTNVHWLSKGNMLGRLYELREEVALFLKIEQNEYLATFNSEEVGLSLAYPTDIFEALNVLNRQLQGKNTTMIAHSDAIRTFIGKLQLWKRRIQNTSSFPRLNEILNKKSFRDSLKTKIEDHLQGLENEFQRYFPNIGERSFVFYLARNPFSLEVDDIPEDLQEQFLELKFNSVAKDDFTSLGMEKFWKKYLSVYQKISQRILQVIVPFSSTYPCEAGFSALVGIKTKKRNKLDVASDLRCTLSQTPPNIPRLVAQKSQYHPSH